MAQHWAVFCRVWLNTKALQSSNCRAKCVSLYYPWLTMKHLDELHIGYFAAFWNQPIIRVVRSIRGKKCDIIILCCTRVCVFWEEGGPGAGSRAGMPPFCGNYWPGGGSHKAVLGSYSNTELFTGGGYGAIKIIRARAEMMAVSDRQMKCYQNRIMML